MSIQYFTILKKEGKNYETIKEFVLCLSVAIPSFAFAGVSGQSVNPTVGSIENELETYLKSSKPEIHIGSAEYVDFLVKLLMYEEDKELAKHPKYEDIKIYASEYLNQINNKESVIERKSDKGEDLRLLSNVEEKKTIETVKTEAKHQEVADKILRNQAASQPTTYAAYSNSKAIAYAKEFANGWNRSYAKHSADCTNFVSQCVNQGGKRLKKPSGTLPRGIKKTTSYWYTARFPNGKASYRYSESSSFVNVGDFYTYWTKHGIKTASYSSKTSLQNGVGLGNVVQLKNGSGKWFHSIIITGGSKGERKFCGHSAPRLDYPVSKIKDAVSYRAFKF